jgi:hypothetical protein
MLHIRISHVLHLPSEGNVTLARAFGFQASFAPIDYNFETDRSLAGMALTQPNIGGDLFKSETIKSKDRQGAKRHM